MFNINTYHMHKASAIVQTKAHSSYISSKKASIESLGVAGAREAVAGSIVVNRLTRDIETETTLRTMISIKFSVGAKETPLTMQPPISTISTLMMVRHVFRGEENHRPQLMCSQ